MTRSGTLWLALAVLLPVLIFSAVRIGFTKHHHETSEDVFWHIAAARRTLPQMTAKNFPMTVSVWRDHYADKELLFHGLLKVYVGLKAALHSPLEPPFHAASIFFALLLFAAFAVAARKLGMPPPAVCVSALLLAGLTPTFTYRVFMLRPHVFSMALMLFAYAILMNGPEKRRTALMIFGMGFLYAWSYSSPHLLIVSAAAFGIVKFRECRFRAFASALAAVLGIAAGYTLHPQFPNTFLVWKVQALDALLAPISAGPVELPWAKELSTPSLSWILLGIPLYILLYLSLQIYIRAKEKKIALPEGVSALMLLACFWTLAMITLSLRPIEYAAPAVCLCFGALYPLAAEHRLLSVYSAREPRTVLLTLLLLSFGIFTWYNCIDTLRTYTREEPFRLAKALKRFVPPGKRVVNINWSDFPVLVFTAPEYEYTWGIEPMFSYAANPKLSKFLARANFMRSRITASEMGMVLDADVAVITDKKKRIGRYLKSGGWIVLYEDDQGWIFSLK